MTWSGIGFSTGERIQYLQAQLFPICTKTGEGYLGSFLSKGLKTNQLEVNTDEKTLKPVARLKEPRDLFALPKDKENDCTQQTARWPSECHVLDERVYHVEWNPPVPELYYNPTGLELKPRPVGEENGTVVFYYNPCPKVDNDSDAGSDSDASSGSRSPSPDRENNDQKEQEQDSGKKCTKHFLKAHYSPSNSDLEEEDEQNLNKCKSLLFNEDDEIVGLHHCAYQPVNHFMDRANRPKPLMHSHSKTPSITTNYESGEEEDDDTNLNNLNTEPYYSVLNFNETIDKKISNISEKLQQAHPSVNSIKHDMQSFLSPQFSRASVGGTKHTLKSSNSTVNSPNPELDSNTLEFESRFESGNLAKAVKITNTYYELYLRPDLYTNRHRQWFYFRVTNTKKNVLYRFSIVNLMKSDSLYNEGMRPLMYSTASSKMNGIGWKRCGDNIAYYRNDEENTEEEDEDSSYTLTFNIKFPYDEDTVYFAHSYPYTYTELQDYLLAIQNHPVKSKYCKLRLLCRSLAGNNVYYLTVTSPTEDDDESFKVRNTFQFKRKKKAIIVSARVHPGETPSSWIMKGVMDFITGESNAAKKLRQKFIFKLIPMLNPDGVIVGNTRSSLTGKDLNRQYRTVIREAYPTVWYSKVMIKRLMDECGVAVYLDLHAHSRKHNIFVYGCENKRSPEKKLTEQVFPLMMHKNSADKFSFEDCRFKIQKNKEGCGRVVMWMLGITNSYTLEASFGGSNLASRNGTHFSAQDYEHMGKVFCETLLDYCDDSPVKEKLRNKILEKLVQQGSNADDPQNIDLTDYTSDEGYTTSDDELEVEKMEDDWLSAESSDEEQERFHIPAPPCSPRKLNPKEQKQIEKAKSSHIRKRSKKNYNRTAMDLPTTDPGSDVHFSTDDENYTSETIEGGYGTLPRSRKNVKQQIGGKNNDNVNHIATDQFRMPPELIVTPAKKKLSRKSLNFEYDKNKNKFYDNLSNNLLTEFPPIKGKHSGRTNSLHSLNKKCLSSLRHYNQNILNNSDHINEALQLKLSLKKKIWTDGQNYENFEKNRPLSWGMPPIHHHKKKEKENIIKDENEILLSACSQKLIEWQERRSTITTENNAAITKNKVTINLLVPEIIEKFNNSIILKSGKKSNNMHARIENNKSNNKDSSSEPKSKKKRNPLTKIAETTQLLTRLAKSKVSIKSDQHQSSKISTINFCNNINNYNNGFNGNNSNITIPLIHVRSGNKFKTSGIVATVQPNRKTKKSRSEQSLRYNEIENPSIHIIATGGDCSENNLYNKDKNFVKRVKCKVKKKKSKS